MADLAHPGPPRPADCRPPAGAGDGEFEAILLRAVTRMAGASGSQVYRELVCCAATLIDADIAFIGIQAPGAEPGVIDTLAAWFDGRAVPNFRYCLEGTPCATVVGRQFRYIRSGIGALYPDPQIAEWQLEAYAAFPLTSASGRPLGLIATMSRRPIENPRRVESLLRIFAERAMAELERNEAESAKLASEGLYRAVFEASVDGLALVDSDGVMVDVNQALATMGGFTREELIGRSSLEFLPPESRAYGLQFLDLVMAEGYARTEQKIRHKSGAILRFEPRGVPVAYLGRPHVLIIMRDITEARARQRALERSEDRLRATVGAALDCIVSMDQHGKVLDFNPAAERCFGYKREDTIGRPLAELIEPAIPGEPPGPLLDYLEAATSPLLGQRTELVCRRADGSAVPMEAALGVADGYEGRILVAYLRDISGQKAVEREREVLEHQLRQAQKMEAIGHLTGGIAHDFNNILTGVLGYIDLALEHGAGNGDHRLERYLDRARRSGERARDLIQQMLTFSRGGRGEARPLCLSKLVEDCVTLLESTLPASIEIETVTPRELPAVVLDPVHASQVLMNLSINARDAMDGHGTLRIELAERPQMHGVCSSCRQAFAGHYIETTVADTGSGIPPEFVDRIFEPFFSTKPTGKGSGMGLATTHGLVHEYYGHIVVESVPGEGTRLRLLLPAAEGPAVACAVDEARQPVQPVLLDGRVLVVDDNAAVAEFMEDLLGEWGLDVTVMRDSERAAETFARTPYAFDLALCDQTMPRLTGIELARRMLAQNPALPVILYTGHSDVVCEASTAAAGIRALVRKPIDSARLRALIAGLLAGRSAVA